MPLYLEIYVWALSESVFVFVYLATIGKLKLTFMIIKSHTITPFFFFIVYLINNPK